jgi:cytochrome bd ubiquinol oxidase subunit I
VDPTTIARWQFGIITVYHFLFVPLTIGLSALVAGLETAWVRTGDPKWLRATKFWGRLFLINFAMGVVTGIVQEFQFGMNWSDYSRFVGDVFGAPLAMEALLAFFLESTFLGLWIFGWGRLPKAAHAACMWLTAIGTVLSAYFILAANAWMQHPVGYRMDRDRARLTSIWKVLTNSTQLVTFPHTITASFLTAGAFVVGIASWHLARGRHVDVMRPSLRLGLVVTVLAGFGVAVTGDIQGKIMTDQQPMKMAAAEALYRDARPASFSLFTIGSLDGSKEIWSLRVPRLLSFLATGSPSSKVDGVNSVQAQEQARYGPGDYRPIIPVTYWTFRLMIGFGGLAALIALAGLWLTRRGRLPGHRRVWQAGFLALFLPFLGNSTGWIFTEMGRQPWVVYGLMQTRKGSSPSVGVGLVLTSLIALTLLYAVLAVVELWLLAKYVKAGPPTEEQALADLQPPPDDSGADSGAEADLALVY